MVDENLQVAKTVHADLVQEVLLLSLDMIREYGQTYQEQVSEFKSKYFEDRSKVKNFTQFTIAIVNNCLICIEHAKQTKDKYWKSTVVGDNKAATRFEALLQTFEALRNRASGYLLEEAFLDLEPYFQKLTKNWLRGTVEIETICVTLKDYFSDYNYLKPKNLDIVMDQGKCLVAKKYLQVLMSRKISLKSQEERREAAEKIIHEQHLMQGLFERPSSTGASSGPGSGLDNPFNACDAIAEVIKVEDLDILSLELHSFIKKYPDVNREQLMAILTLRGDLGRGDIKQRAGEIIPEEGPGSRGGVAVRKSIFSQVHVPPSLF
jgi:exocyst complex component 3